MSAGTDQALETLGEVIAAYKARIAELEAIVQNQQQQLNERPPPPRDGDKKK